MDIGTLAQDLTAFLAPFLPYLVEAGKKVGSRASEEIGKRFGEAAWQKAQALWDALRGKPNVEQVARTAAALPDNQALREALREEIERALAEDQALATTVMRLWAQVQTTQQTTTAVGNRSVAIGGDVTNTVIITGDHNRVDRG